MDFQGSHKFAAPPQKVWDALLNASALKESIPGAKDVSVSGSTITVTADIPLPGIGTKSGTLNIVNQNPPSSATLNGGVGPVKANIVLNLAADGAGTNLDYNIQVDGVPGIPGLSGIAKGQIDKFFTNLEAKV
jgi:carbon monoxide dehydrogenase subunit G